MCEKDFEATTDNFYSFKSRGKTYLKAQCKSCYKIINAEKYAKNKERHRELCRKWHQENKESVQKRRKAYRQTKEYKVRNVMYANRRRTRELTPTQFQTVANQDLITKIYQNCPDGYDVDHMRALSKGGDHHESNLCYLPSKVNSSKKAQSIEEFGVERFNEHVLYWQDIIPT